MDGLPDSAIDSDLWRNLCDQRGKSLKKRKDLFMNSDGTEEVRFLIKREGSFAVWQSYTNHYQPTVLVVYKDTVLYEIPLQIFAEDALRVEAKDVQSQLQQPALYEKVKRLNQIHAIFSLMYPPMECCLERLEKPEYPIDIGAAARGRGGPSLDKMKKKLDGIFSAGRRYIPEPKKKGFFYNKYLIFFYSNSRF